MKVYVCYKAWMYEGCSEPFAVFYYRKDAIAWCKDNKKSESQDAEYVELEVK